MGDFKSASLNLKVNTEDSVLKTNVTFYTQDYGSAKLIFTIFKDNNPLDLTGSTAEITFMMADKSTFLKAATIDDAANGIVSYIMQSDILEHAGIAKAELTIQYSETQSLSIGQFQFNINKSLVDENNPAGVEFYVSSIEQIKNNYDLWVDNAKKSNEQKMADYDTWFNNVKTMNEQQISDYDTWLNDTTTQKESDFDTWFNNVKGQLSTDPAGNLQNEIGNLTDLQTTDKTNLVSAVNETTSQLAEIATNVKTLGAAGDGVTDDTAKILQALDTGNVYFPAGTYLINQALLKNTGSKLKITADKNAILKVGNAFPTNRSVIQISGVNDVFIDGLTIDGSRVERGFLDATNYIHGIYVENASEKVSITNIHVKNAPSAGIYLVNNDNVYVGHCLVEDYMYHGIHTNNCRETLVEGCKIVGIGDVGDNINYGGEGYLGTKGEKCIVKDTYAYNTSDSSIKTEGISDVIFDNCYVEDSGKDALKIMWYGADTIVKTFAKVVNCTAKYTHYWRYTGNALIQVSGMKYAVILGNTVIGGLKTKGEENGIVVKDSGEQVIIANNIINDVISKAIKIDSSSDILIDSNIMNTPIATNNCMGEILIRKNIIKAKAMTSGIAIAEYHSTFLKVQGNTIVNFVNSILFEPGSGSKEYIADDNEIRNANGYAIRVKNYSSSLYSLDYVALTNNRMTDIATSTNVSSAMDISILNLNIKEVKVTDNKLRQNNLAYTVSNIYSVIDSGTNILLSEIARNRDEGTTSSIVFLNKSERVIGDTINNVVPTSGTWLKGDRIRNSSTNATTPSYWECVVSGTQGTLTGVTATTTATSKTVTVNSSTNLKVGQFITITGVTGTKKILDISGTTITIDTAADVSVTDASVSYSNPSWRAVAGATA